MSTIPSLKIYSYKHCMKFVKDCVEKNWCRKLLTILPLLYGYDTVHGFPHIIRVACIAERIIEELGENNNIDRDVFLAAVLLHDIGRYGEARGLHHAITSAFIARELLELIGFRREKLEQTARAILEHSYSLKIKPSTIEACILSDADKIDALGPAGIYRAIVFGERNCRALSGTIEHYKDKLAKLFDSLCLNASRSIAREADRLARVFFEALEDLDNITAKVMEYVLEDLKRRLGKNIPGKDSGKNT